jgi:hypothetical protein
MSLLHLTTYINRDQLKQCSLVVMETLVACCRMNPLAIAVILSDEFSSVRKLIKEENFLVEWKIALSEILEPKGTSDFFINMSDEILFKLVEYLDSIFRNDEEELIYPSAMKKQNMSL